MTLLVAGLVLFLGTHLLPTAPALRSALVSQFGDRRYRSAFAVLSALGLVLIVVGFGHAPIGRQLFAPSPAAISIAPIAMPVAFVLFAASNMQTHIRRVLKHPMLLGLLIWAGVHLFANGNARATVLFGAFTAYALVDLASAVSRHAVKPIAPRARQDAVAIVAGIAVALVVMTYHRSLFGVAVVPFGR